MVQISKQSIHSFALGNRRRRFVALAPLMVFLSSLALKPDTAAPNAPPPTHRDEVKEVLHGVEIADPYRWLENQKSPETRAWIEAENAYTRSRLRSLPGREQIAQQLSALMKIETISTPIERNGRYFFSKRLAGQDLFVIYVRKCPKGPDEVLIDPHPMSKDHSTSVSLEDVVRDGTLVAYGVRRGGEDETTIKLLDVDTRKSLPDELPRAYYFGASIKLDKSGIYYSRRTPQGPRVFYHAMGTDTQRDVELFGKGYGPEVIINSNLSDDGRYLVIHVAYGSAADKTEIYYQDLALQTPIQTVVNDISARFYGSVGGNHLFVHTNWKAPNGRILAVDLNQPSRDHWREVIPQTDSVIDNLSVAAGKLFVNYLDKVVAHLEVFSAQGRRLTELAFPALGTVSDVTGRWDGHEVFFAFSSFHIPTTIYRYEVSQGSQDVWARLNVPIDSDKFELQQVWYESKDKTKIPVFILCKKGLKLDGTNPTLLTGYGGFDVSLTPSFSATAALWAEEGGVFAVPNLRGGGEFGEAWHKAGMLERKQNVFDDFLSAAEWLIAKGYTQPSKLVISGASNGGLLVGAAFTQRPDLFQAVVCRYPLLDMLRYQDFLVARFWVPEYGSSEDAQQFKYLYAYSPYQNVRRGTKYPAVLFVSGDGDTRVDPLHARKMAAMLQWATGSNRPVLLDYDTQSGHSGGRPLSKQIEELTDEMSFLFWQVGVDLTSKLN